MMTTDQKSSAKGIITKIERQTRIPHRYHLYIDECFACSVHEDVLIKYRLMKGIEIDAVKLQRILHEEEIQRAYLDSIRLLSSRLRSEHEMRTRLKQKDYTDEIVDETIHRLHKEQYLNDILFAEQLAKQRLESQKKGRHWIRQELQQKGISKDKIQMTIEHVDGQTEFQMAYQLAEKRYSKEMKHDPLKARRKIAGFLQRRGYPGSIITKVLNRLPMKMDFEEDLHVVDELDDI